MAKVKFNFKEFLLQKGEKIVLGIALAGLGLFAVMGVSHFVAAESPAAKSEKFKSEAKRIEESIRRPEGDPGVKPLEEWVNSQMSMKPIDPRDFRSAYLPFETVEGISSKKDNPAVLGITDAQVDLVRAPVKAYEVLVRENGTEIGVLTSVKISPADVEKMKKLLETQNNRFRRPNQPAPAPAPAAAPPPTPAPSPNVATSIPTSGRRGEGGPPGAAQGTEEKRSELTLRYVPLEDFDKEIQKEGVLPAFSVYPIRMIVVNASFPLKEQLEVIRRALRLKSIAEAEQETRPPTGQGPTFLGFEVERRIIAPNGQIYDWQPYDHIAQYQQKLNIRKFADQPDDGLLTYFLRYDQMMAMPLPALAANLGIYPGVRIKAIMDGYKKLVDANKKPETPSDLQKKFQGQQQGANPFLPATGADTGAFGGAFQGSGPATGIAAEGGRRPNPGAPESGRGGRPGAEMSPAPGSSIIVPQNMPELEHMLIRFLDVDIRPGFTYQYRLRVKMKNPNFGKLKEVARPDDSKQEVLWGPWVTIANQVNVPQDQNIYASDPIAYTEMVRREYKDRAVQNIMDNKNGEQPVVQFQNWIPRVPIESGKSEPAGYWVVAEVPVSRGEYIGRKQIVPLPMWSSEKVAFILQELPKYNFWQQSKNTEKPKGLLVDFSSPMLMVDYVGGKVKEKVGERLIDDEADVEMMILKPDGSVMVRNAGTDRADADRKAREEAWKKWIDEIRRASESIHLTNPNAPGAFGGRN